MKISLNFLTNEFLGGPLFSQIAIIRDPSPNQQYISEFIFANKLAGNFDMSNRYSRYELTKLVKKGSLEEIDIPKVSTMLYRSI